MSVFYRVRVCARSSFLAFLLWPYCTMGIKNFFFQMSTQMEKLENTVNTLRTVLSQKISSEAKTVSTR